MANDSIIGAVTLTELPDLTCVANGEEFAQALASKMVVQFPGGTNQGVLVSTTPPADPAVTGLWVKIDTAGVFDGLYAFSAGTWTEIVPP